MGDLVTCRVADGVAVVRMDDGKANALSHEMIDAVMGVLDDAAPEGALVLTGRPGRFCGGFDMKVMMSGPAAAAGLVRRGADLLLRLYELPMPLVIACTGHAVAGGALLVLTGDTRFGVRGDFRIGLNEVAIGLPLPILAGAFARDRLHSRHLTAATIQAALYDPDAAVEAGYLDRVLDGEVLEATAVDEARRLGTLSRQAYAETKKLMRAATIEHVRSTLDADMARFMGPGA